MESTRKIDYKKPGYTFILRTGKQKRSESRGPLDGLLEAFYRSPTGAGIRERKPPRIQRLQRQVEHQPLDSLGELEPARILSPRQRKFSGNERETGTVGNLWKFQSILNESFGPFI